MAGHPGGEGGPRPGLGTPGRRTHSRPMHNGKRAHAYNQAGSSVTRPQCPRASAPSHPGRPHHGAPRNDASHGAPHHPPRRCRDHGLGHAPLPRGRLGVVASRSWQRPRPLWRHGLVARVVMGPCRPVLVRGTRCATARVSAPWRPGQASAQGGTLRAGRAAPGVATTSPPRRGGAGPLGSAATDAGALTTKIATRSAIGASEPPGQLPRPRLPWRASLGAPSPRSYAMSKILRFASKDSCCANGCSR